MKSIIASQIHARTEAPVKMTTTNTRAHAQTVSGVTTAKRILTSAPKTHNSVKTAEVVRIPMVDSCKCPSPLQMKIYH